MSHPARLPSALRLAAVALVLAPGGAGAVQVPTGPLDTTEVVADPGDVVSVGRAAQARFEQRRVRYLPLGPESFGGSCDETIGRICTTYSEGEWYPVPERDEVVQLRAELVAQLDSLQALAPSSEWILGQRVWYRGEGGDWAGALMAARSCGDVRRAWCEALEGLALHGLGRFEEAEEAFTRALEGMDGEEAALWRLPRWPVDGDTRDLFDDARGDPDAERELLRRLWLLADPLFLVPGNDRLTEHYARWTVTSLRDRSRVAYRMTWGDDLTQLTVRHGWEIGWERRPSPDYTRLDYVIGHKHPEGREYMPPGKVLGSPERATADDLTPRVRRPRSLYAPAYAPVLLPMDAQLAVFPRGQRTIIVATHFLPEDTTFHAGHRHPVPWLEPGVQAHMADRTGLFAIPLDPSDARDAAREIRAGTGADARVEARADVRTHVGTEMSTAVTPGRSDGVSVLDVATGAYLVSAESWSPSRRRAGRLRTGVPARPAPEDIATLSDLLLLAVDVQEPTSLEGAVGAALLRPRVAPGQPFAVAWEVSGLGFRPESLAFELSVERTDRGVLQRIGQFLGLADRPRPLALTWEEPGPPEPRPDFHYLELDIPELEEGRYEIRLVLRTSGRSEAVSVLALVVAAPDPS